jgi:hypothetical protein
MEAQWIDDCIQPYRKELDFMSFYNKLKTCFWKISEGDTIARDEISTTIRCVFEEVPMDEKDSSPVDITWDKRLQHTYREIDKTSNPYTTHLPLSLTRKRDLLYRACLGYIPNKDQLPKSIEMARALASNLPPPNLPTLDLWKCLNLCPVDGGRGIVINTAIPDRCNVREYRVVDAKGLMNFCERQDQSAGEVFNSDMWCTGITFDIDGKTCDALKFGSSCYSLPSIERELILAMKEELMALTDNRWDVQNLTPPIHVWIPEEVDCKKLSLRISVHFPKNVCFESISDVSMFVGKISRNLGKIKAKYLILRYVESGGVKYEKSHMESFMWYGINSQGERVSLEDAIRNVTVGHPINILLRDGSFNVTRNERDGHIYVTECHGTSPHRIEDITTWIQYEIERRAQEECLVDCGIYHHNKSLRLPLQSKIVDGTYVRKLLPITKHSSVLDALIHYPHTDIPNIPGAPILMKYAQYSSPTMNSTHLSLSLEKAKEVIHSKYSMHVTKVTERDGKAYLDVTRDSDPNPGGGNYCLIKGDMHSSARMFFVLDNKGMLSLGCWSSNCRKKSMKNNLSINVTL